MYSVIPLNSVPHQIMNVILSGKIFRIELKQRTNSLTFSLWANDQTVVLNALCQNKNDIIHQPYKNIGGDFLFIDTQGEDNPYYTGLGTRFILLYRADND